MDIRLRRSVENEVKARRRRLEELMTRRVMQSPRHYVEDKRLMLDHSQDKLLSALRSVTSKSRERYARLAAGLDAMSPLKVLGRGYAIAHKADGSIIKTAKDVNQGDRISIKLQKDEITATVM
jgi:exodeoxyribonuclease VII large subunit